MNAPKALSGAAAALLGATWGDIEVVERDGYLLFPSELRRRKGDGELEVKKVMLRVPRQAEKRKARVEARKVALAEGLDLDRDADMVADIENVVLLAWAIRSATSPFEPLEVDHKILEKAWDSASLADAYAKLDAASLAVDPAESEISEAEILVLLAKLAKERSIAPLVEYGPGARATFIVYTAVRLLSFLSSSSSEA